MSKTKQQTFNIAGRKIVVKVTLRTSVGNPIGYSAMIKEDTTGRILKIPMIQTLSPQEAINLTLSLFRNHPNGPGRFVCEKVNNGWEVRRRNNLHSTFFVLEEHARLKVTLANDFLDSIKKDGSTPEIRARLKLFMAIIDGRKERGLPV